jgi:flagellar basal-body rod protein FlgB
MSISRSMVESTSIPLLEQVVRFAQARHGVLAGNLANLDTPGYKVQDLSVEAFEARLKEAASAGRRSGVRSPGETSFESSEPARESLRSILYHDQSDVGLEQQVSEIAKNQMKHNLALSLMTNQFRLLQAAISEQATA